MMIHRLRFYDNSIPSGTKITALYIQNLIKFYDNSIPSGTKIRLRI